MASMQTVRKKFKSWNGIKEGAKCDRVIISPWNTKTHRHCKSTSTPWCAIYIASGLLQCNVKKLSLSAGCKQQYNFYKKYGRIHKTGKTGDIVFIGTSFSHITHMGYRTSSTYYISGNCNNRVKYSRIKGAKILCYATPFYS